jgi:hypothetical protein
LDWEDSHFHLETLQAKINTYISAIDSEEVFYHYPNAISNEIVIKIVAKYELPQVGVEFIKKVKLFLREMNVELQFTVFIE